MVTYKETSAVIIALHKKGFTGKDITASKIAPKSTINRIIKNFKESGSNVVKKASGRPSKSSKLHKVDSAAGSVHHQYRACSGMAQAGVSASARTVRQRLLEDGLVSRRAAKKPLLSRKNIRNRLIFCKRYRDWTDESPFRLFGASGK